MEKKEVKTDSGIYNERNLAQLIRRKMMTREFRNKTKYTRKIKHKKDEGE